MNRMVHTNGLNGLVNGLSGFSGCENERMRIVGTGLVELAKSRFDGVPVQF